MVERGILESKEGFVGVFAQFKGKAKFDKFFDRLNKVGDDRAMSCCYFDDNIFCYHETYDLSANINDFMLVYSNNSDNVDFATVIRNE